ncbi:lytic transglycosylase domain-containing protein [Actinokineospora sp. 24-640]
MGRIERLRAEQEARSETLAARREVGFAALLVAVCVGAALLVGHQPAIVEQAANRQAANRSAPVAGAQRTPPSIPAVAVEQPAGVAPLAVPQVLREGPAPAVPGELVVSGVPSTALAAYRDAEAVLRAQKPGCGLDWPLTAAIGRVETNHGRFGGAELTPEGTSVPPIRGPRLDGVVFAHIADTDGGRLDGDTEYDRAVGPMQFLPSTWEIVRADGNGDGVGDPHNIFDAALGAGVYLCSGSTDLTDDTSRRAAVFRYNRSDAYVALVLSLADEYRLSGFTVVEPPLPGAREIPGDPRTVARARTAAAAPAQAGQAGRTGQSGQAGQAPARPGAPTTTAPRTIPPSTTAAGPPAPSTTRTTTTHPPVPSTPTTTPPGTTTEPATTSPPAVSIGLGPLRIVLPLG